MSPSSPVTEEKKSDEVTFSCSVSTNTGCPYKVSWLNDKTEVKDEVNIKISHHNCTFTSLKILTSVVIYKPKLESLSCQFKDVISGEVQLFPFSRRPSGEKPGENVFKATST